MSAKSSAYFVMDTLGHGTFGKVLQCMKHGTKEVVAVKTIPEKFAWIGKREADIFKHLMECGHVTDNIVRFNGHSEQHGEVLLEFEMLDMTIDGFMSKVSRPLHLSEIQIITRQMLEALNTLKSLGLAHVDIKPNNIMFINHELQPMKVKLIDFGLALYVSELTTGRKIQNPNYRAPEVMLGLPLNEAVDMWSLGCTLVYMYLHSHLFSKVTCEHQIMRETVHMLGQPEDHLLDTGIHVEDHFFKEGDSWKLKETCICAQTNPENCERFSSLDEIVLTLPHTVKTEDTQAFLSLLKDMLQMDPKQRTTPKEALRHPFITMTHFPREPAAKPNMPSTSLTGQDSQKVDCNMRAELAEGEHDSCSAGHYSDDCYCDRLADLEYGTDDETSYGCQDSDVDDFHSTEKIMVGKRATRCLFRIHRLFTRMFK